MAQLDEHASNAYNASMATILVRNLPEAVHAALKIRAARNGRSMEAEAREILAGSATQGTGVLSPTDVQARAAERYRHVPPGVSAVDELIAERRREFLNEEEEYLQRKRRR